MKHVSILILLLFASALLGQTELYWVNTFGDIFKSNIDGSSVTNIRSGIGFGEDITFNPETNQLIYVNGSGGAQSSVNVMDTDGGNHMVLVDNLSSPDGVALDLCTQKIYFAQSDNSSISRMNMDGSGIEEVLNVASGVEGIAVSPENEKLYWVSPGGGTIMSANYDGSGVATVVSGLSGPVKLAKNMSTGEIYFTEFFSGNVRKVNPDGSGLQTLVSGLSSPGGIVLDVPSNRMYFTSISGIHRAGLDGSGASLLVTQSNTKLGLAIDNQGNACRSSMSAEPIPTLGEWGVALMLLLLSTIGVVAVKNRNLSIA